MNEKSDPVAYLAVQGHFLFKFAVPKREVCPKEFSRKEHVFH